LLVSAAGVASADTGYDAQYTSSITYQNIGSGPANLVFQFYPEMNGTPHTYTPPQLAAGAASSVFAGSISNLPAGFLGSLVISSDQPIVATGVQISTGANTQVKNRGLSNGFAAGTPNVLIPTVLKNRFNSTTRFSIQNASTSGGVDLVVKFFDADNAGALVHTINVTNVPAGAAKYFDAGTITQLANGFNGSATADAFQTGTSTPSSAVGSALELGTTNTNISAFEGTGGGAATLYAPSAICDAFGGQNTAYAIQNTSTSASANVSVAYKDLSGNTVATANKTIGPGAKASFVACSDGAPAGFSGSATITSSGANVVGVAKVYGAGLYTAALGATAGAAKLYLPYVRWSETQYTTGVRQRVYIAIQNIGGPLAAGDVKVTFVDKNGAQVGSQVSNSGALGTGQKFSTNPSAAGPAASEFGYYPDGSIGGAAIVEGPAGSQLVAVARVTSYNTTANDGSLFGEDYVGQ
jgi:hypothetical protein